MPKTIAFVLFDGAEELDFAGPWEVFGVVAAMKPDECQVFTVSEKGGQVRCANGLRVVVDHSFADAPVADIVIVPGGQGTRVEMDNPAMLDYLRNAARTADYTTSVCTGALVLANAGLLEGKKATTWWGMREQLGKLGDIEVVEDTRFVDQSPIITAAGVSAGIDMALFLAGKLWGPEQARLIQKYIEYFPDPPYADVPIPEPAALA